MGYSAPRGTHDILPTESHRWRSLERAFEDLVSLYGYAEIRTPAFEDTELFVRTSGDTSEVVTKQMYTFEDKGGRSITLKPEGTAPAVRAYLEHGLGQQGAVTRLWYATPIFRYERPQKGRYRQAHQVGLELIGSESPAADCEVIEITVRFYEALGIRGLRVLVNSLGREETRARYRAVLLDHARPYLETLEPDVRSRYERNPLRILDSKDPEAIAAMADAPRVLDYLEEASKAHFDALRGLLDEAGIEYVVAPEVVRGLDYYTDTVFEVQSTSLGAQSALCGGGRYDNLIHEIGGPRTPSVGVAMGVERALMVQEAEGVDVAAPTPRAFLVSATPEARAEVRALARSLRAAGLACIIDLDGRSMKSQLKAADRSGAPIAVLIGTDELAARTATVRDLRTSTQKSVPRDSVVEEVRRA